VARRGAAVVGGREETKLSSTSSGFAALVKGKRSQFSDYSTQAQI